MELIAHSVYKRFYRNWILKDFNYHFQKDKVYGISGSNGSGKSTLLQILSGMMNPSKGKIQFLKNGVQIDEENWYTNFTYAAPYAELYDYMTVKELTNHHVHFKKLKKGIQVDQFIDICYLNGHEDKWIKYFSSGMKQRLKLGLSILSEADIIFLDEPLSNLDLQAKKWYKDLLLKYTQNQMIIIASNEVEDFEVVHHQIKLGDG